MLQFKEVIKFSAMDRTSAKTINTENVFEGGQGASLGEFS